MYVMPILLVPFFVWSWWLDAAFGALTDAERVKARSGLNEIQAEAALPASIVA
jgi:hypothetical protein